jgi:hypothetical protein
MSKVTKAGCSLVTMGLGQREALSFSVGKYIICIGDSQIRVYG